VGMLAYFLHCPTVCDCQTREQSFLIGAAPSHCTEVGGGAFPRGVKPLGLDILCGADCPGTCGTKSFVEKLPFTSA
jgi:hypothetical protein